MVITVDLDGTLCVEKVNWWEDEFPTPIRANIKKVRRLSKDHTIIIYTARPWGDYDKTVKWLNDNGVPFDRVVLGKVRADVYIDDNAFKMEEINDSVIQRWS